MGDQDFIRSVEHCLKDVNRDLLPENDRRLLEAIEGCISFQGNALDSTIVQLYLCDLVRFLGKHLFSEEVASTLAIKARLEEESIVEKEGIGPALLLEQALIKDLSEKRQKQARRN